MNGAASDFQVPGVEPTFRGKVRDIYDLGDRLLLVATDRVSAFDVILDDPVPERGCILTAISEFWFEKLAAQGVAHHLISSKAADLPDPYRHEAEGWGSRIMLTRKLDMVPIECVARGYLTGSGWKEYQESRSVCGIPLPEGLQDGSELPEPIFTPATKATEGHDINISFEDACDRVGTELMEELRRLTLMIYSTGRDLARDCGVILADTKFEFGLGGDQPGPVLADEVLTPDSSRYWPADQYQPGQAQPSFDKQYVRDHLLSVGWNREPPAPRLPQEVINGTRERYEEIYQRLTGKAWTRKGGN